MTYLMEKECFTSDNALARNTVEVAQVIPLHSIYFDFCPPSWAGLVYYMRLHHRQSVILIPMPSGEDNASSKMYLTIRCKILLPFLLLLLWLSPLFAEAFLLLLLFLSYSFISKDRKVCSIWFEMDSSVVVEWNIIEYTLKLSQLFCFDFESIESDCNQC